MRPELFPVEPVVAGEWWREGEVMQTVIMRSEPEWRDVVVRAYAMQPTLSVTGAQGQRLWGMDARTCGHVLDGLVESGVLARTSGGQYCRADVLQPMLVDFCL